MECHGADEAHFHLCTAFKTLYKGLYKSFEAFLHHVMDERMLLILARELGERGKVF